MLFKVVTGDARRRWHAARGAGRVEFEEVLPASTSCAIIAPIGSRGVLIAGGDTQRGFGRIDQAWISTIADKLDDTFENYGPGGGGFKA